MTRSERRVVSGRRSRCCAAVVEGTGTSVMARGAAMLALRLNGLCGLPSPSARLWGGGVPPPGGAILLHRAAIPPAPLRSTAPEPTSNSCTGSPQCARSCPRRTARSCVRRRVSALGQRSRQQQRDGVRTPRPGPRRRRPPPGSSTTVACASFLCASPHAGRVTRRNSGAGFRQGGPRVPVGFAE